MSNELSFTIEEVSRLLKVSKLTVYDLVKKGVLPVFRVGRQMRVSAKELDRYVHQQKRNQPLAGHEVVQLATNDLKNIVISGQDLVLDILGNHIEKITGFKVLRSYKGSLNSLISMFKGDCDIVSMHLFDGDTGEYNLPYIRKILVGFPYVLLHLLSRKAGLYVRKGNPLKITSWADLKREDLTFVNREIGSGARILLDEQLRLHGISARTIKGYDHEEANHLSVASAISAGTADVGVGIEKAAKIVGVDFIPLITERYDIAILKKPETERLIEVVQKILTSEHFHSEIKSLGDYDPSDTGKVIYETW